MIPVPPMIAAHLPIIIGLALGTLGKYGMDVDRGIPVTVRKVTAQLMMLGVLGLIAEVTADAGRLAATPRALCGATAALLSSWLVLRWEGWAKRQAEQRLPIDDDRET